MDGIISVDMEYIWVKADEKNIEHKVRERLEQGWTLFEQPFKTKNITMDDGKEIQYFSQVMTRDVNKKAISKNKNKK
jgi:hypothetical protein